MWYSFLEFALWFVAYVHPLILGTQLCIQERNRQLVDSKLITNITLSMIVLWVLDMADVLILSHLLSMRSLYMVLRIILALYLLHPKFNGAIKAYNRFFADIIRLYSPIVDDLVTYHLNELSRTGAARYLTRVGISLITVGADLIDIIKQLLNASTETGLPPANIARRLTPPREDENEVLIPTTKITTMPWGGGGGGGGGGGETFSRGGSNLLDYLKSTQHNLNHWESSETFMELYSHSESCFSAEEEVLPVRKRHPNKS